MIGQSSIQKGGWRLLTVAVPIVEMLYGSTLPVTNKLKTLSTVAWRDFTATGEENLRSLVFRAEGFKHYTYVQAFGGFGALVWIVRSKY